MKKQTNNSIRKQLFIWLLPSLSLLWVLSAVVTYILAESYADEVYDDQLLNSADSVIGRLRLKEGGVEVDLPAPVLNMLRHNFRDKFYYQVISSDGKLIDGDRELPIPEKLPDFSEPHFDYSSANGERVRTVLVEAFVEEAPSKQVYVYSAETLESRKALARHILINTTISQLILIVCGAVTVWFGISLGLIKLESLAKAVSGRRKNDLSPIDENEAPLEVRSLVRAINELLFQVRDDLAAKQRFVANAAHQLRTPVAGIKTYIGILKKMVDNDAASEVIKQLDTGVDRTTHMINRLLSLAKAEPHGGVQIEKVPVDLNALASEAAANLVVEAVAKNIDLSFECSETEAFVMGDRGSLLELVSNLVENAVRYTPESGSVVVKVKTEENLSLIVEDNGVGIPLEERERVFERFYRILGNTASGSGLGLAIVSEIARLHNARVLIDSGAQGVGTKILVEFMKDDWKMPSVDAGSGRRREAIND